MRKSAQIQNTAKILPKYCQNTAKILQKYCTKKLCVPHDIVYCYFLAAIDEKNKQTMCSMKHGKKFVLPFLERKGSEKNFFGKTAARFFLLFVRSGELFRKKL